ncbi:acyl-CoA dehydrogenase family protein [Haloechinothrix aidingensis]|uniref:acyl-CoA dehydrogenase family protein n=1 Tax=Haloechinothrix aidingensis TaxID=2752311 RepID=UPI001C60AE79|nr:acyl-CoA dehydrogenase family protein [Haloechinothrix aidingensis]
MTARRPSKYDGTEGVLADPDDVAVFRNMSFEDERKLLDECMAWQQAKFDAGYGAISWPAEFDGAGLTIAHERAFQEEERSFKVPSSHESLRITVNLAAPMLREVGTPWQQERFVRSFLRCDELACQLFSEPNAGSDLAGIAMTARPDGDEWVLNGTKVWSSGAQFASWGVLVARTDPDVPKHRGMTAFLLPINSPGIEVRPIRQMSGGTSFNEVFLTDVRISDDLRLGAVGQGWSVALTMLKFERAQSGSSEAVGGSLEQLLTLAKETDRVRDPAVRQRIVQVYMHERLRAVTRQRVEDARRCGKEPGSEGSIGKLAWSQGLIAIGEAAALLLGPLMIADTGRRGTYAWSEHVLGAPGFRIAGGTDEVQRNIIAERVLGLPPEPRVDRDRPWRDVPR